MVTILAENGANKRLDKFLSEYLIESSRTIVKKMISEGMVYVDGGKSAINAALKLSFTDCVQRALHMFLTSSGSAEISLYIKSCASEACYPSAFVVPFN